MADEGTISPMPRITDTPSLDVLEVFRNLTKEDQDELLRMIISEGDIKRIISLAESMSLPGNVELFLDRVQYHHFLPIAENVSED